MTGALPQGVVDARLEAAASSMFAFELPEQPPSRTDATPTKINRYAFVRLIFSPVLILQIVTLAAQILNSYQIFYIFAYIFCVYLIYYMPDV